MKNGHTLPPRPALPGALPGSPSERPPTKSIQERVQEINDPWVLTTALHIFIDVALALGFKYCNRNGDPLTTRDAVLETLRQEGAVVSKGKT